LTPIRPGEDLRDTSLNSSNDAVSYMNDHYPVAGDHKAEQRAGIVRPASTVLPHQFIDSVSGLSDDVPAPE
jgi:hypothetical protein